MRWQIAKLIKESTKSIEIDECIDFSTVVERNPDVRRISKVNIAGDADVRFSERKAIFRLSIKGEMTLGCAISLDDVVCPIDIDAEFVFVWDSAYYDEANEEHLINGDVIELAPMIWQEIFLQIPLRVVKDGAYDVLKEQGIEVESEEDYLNRESDKIDPRLAVLSQLKIDE